MDPVIPPAEPYLAGHFQSEWEFARGLTIDLVESLSDHELLFSPGPRLGPFWKQIRHAGQVQADHLAALARGQVRFSVYYRRILNKSFPQSWSAWGI